MTREPFSFVVKAGDIPAAGRHVHVVADDAARRRVADALGIPDVAMLAADVELRPVGDGDFSVRGALRAAVVQTDVVTLDPVAQEVREEIDVTLARAEDRRRDDGDAVDAGDVYHNGRIDLGAIVTEHLALGLDPYPRAAGVPFEGHIEDDPASDPSPFAALGTLKGGGG